MDKFTPDGRVDLATLEADLDIAALPPDVMERVRAVIGECRSARLRSAFGGMALDLASRVLAPAPKPAASTPLLHPLPKRKP